MSSNSEYHDYIVHDVLGGIPGITSRKMFSGFGIYKDGIVFAIIADGDLYFRTDDKNRPDFEKYGSEPFSYPRAGKTATLKNYWRLPEEIMEDKEKIFDWVEEAVRASVERQKKKTS
ncbi:MAG: TfoX/Sxy family protein [Parcubacteria group bacterium]|nr:TfoX/Sxy family protein [Parcubacteria group bacterium]